MSDVAFFSWDTPGRPFAGSVAYWDRIVKEASPYLDNPPEAEKWAATELLDAKMSGRRRTALEQFLYLLLARPEGATRLTEDDRYGGDDRAPTLLERGNEVADRFTKLPKRQKAREHLLLDFESVFRSREPDPLRNDKLAILCELLLSHPGEPSPAPRTAPRRRTR